MKKHILLLLIFFIVVGSVFSANDNYPFGGRSAGMANAAVTLYDFWAVSHNQAGIALEDNMAAGFYYENRFGLKELGLGAGAFVLPTDAGNFGLNFTYFGYSQYNESKVGLAYARNFGENLSAGLQLNYLSTSIAEDYGSQANFTFELGAIYQLIDNFYVGAHLYNPVKAKIGDYDDERIPTILRFGMSYLFSERVMVILETEKDINQPYNFKLGIEYHITDPVYIRGGIGTDNNQNAFGAGILFSNFRIDLAASYHNVLGYSPQFSMIYEFQQ